MVRWQTFFSVLLVPWPIRSLVYLSGCSNANITEVLACPGSIIRANRKTLAVQEGDWFVLGLFPLKKTLRWRPREGAKTKAALG